MSGAHTGSPKWIRRSLIGVTAALMIGGGIGVAANAAPGADDSSVVQLELCNRVDDPQSKVTDVEITGVNQNGDTVTDDSIATLNVGDCSKITGVLWRTGQTLDISLNSVGGSFSSGIDIPSVVNGDTFTYSLGQSPPSS
jgi:hypothetical protein